MMVFGPEAGLFFFMLLWVGGLGSVLAGMTFASFVRSSPGPFTFGALAPIVKGVAFAWLIGALLAVLWNLDVVSSRFMEGSPVLAVVAITIGLASGIAGFRRQRDRDLG
jgi:hypothetical protein